MITRLQQRAPELSQLLRQSAEIQHGLRLRLWSFLVDQLRNRNGIELPQDSEGGSEVTGSVRIRLRDLAEKLDDEYLTLHEREAAKADGAFSAARAAAALASLASGQLEEALYEALFVGGEEELRRLVEIELKSKRG